MNIQLSFLAAKKRCLKDDCLCTWEKCEVIRFQVLHWKLLTKIAKHHQQWVTTKHVSDRVNCETPTMHGPFGISIKYLKLKHLNWTPLIYPPLGWAFQCALIWGWDASRKVWHHWQDFTTKKLWTMIKETFAYMLSLQPRSQGLHSQEALSNVSNQSSP